MRSPLALARWTRPLGIFLPLTVLTGLGKSKSQLMVENALLQKPLIMLKRQVKRPACTKTDRVLVVMLARVGSNLKARPLDCATRHEAREGRGSSFDRSQAFFLIELQSGKVIHVGVTRSPTDRWVARTAPRSDSR